MEKVNVRKQDEILMSLAHYFVTKEGYAPIYVQGVKDEIWLENIDGPYRIIRINSNYIHNEEQYKYDEVKIRNIMGQIKKKTLSFKVNTLNINLNVSDRVKVESEKNIDNIFVKDIDEIKKNKEINEVSKYNYVIVNDDIEESLLKMNSIIECEKCRVDRIEEVYLGNQEEMIHELLIDFDKENYK